jgi:hypothetical protein
MIAREHRTKLSHVSPGRLFGCDATRRDVPRIGRVEDANDGSIVDRFAPLSGQDNWSQKGHRSDSP